MWNKVLNIARLRHCFMFFRNQKRQMDRKGNLDKLRLLIASAI